MGGFQDRSGTSDLYYTVFGLESLQALRVDLPIHQVHKYLQSFGDGADLDFIHPSMSRALLGVNADRVAFARSASSDFTTGRERVPQRRTAATRSNAMPRLARSMAASWQWAHTKIVVQHCRTLQVY